MRNIHKDSDEETVIFNPREKKHVRNKISPHIPGSEVKSMVRDPRLSYAPSNQQYMYSHLPPTVHKVIQHLDPSLYQHQQHSGSTLQNNRNTPLPKLPIYPPPTVPQNVTHYTSPNLLVSAPSMCPPPNISVPSTYTTTTPTHLKSTTSHHHREYVDDRYTDVPNHRRDEQYDLFKKEKRHSSRSREKTMQQDLYREEKRHSAKNTVVDFKSFKTRYSSDKLKKHILTRTDGGFLTFLKKNSQYIFKTGWQREIVPRRRISDKEFSPVNDNSDHCNTTTTDSFDSGKIIDENNREPNYDFPPVPSLQQLKDMLKFMQNKDEIYSDDGSNTGHDRESERVEANISRYKCSAKQSSNSESFTHSSKHYDIESQMVSDHQEPKVDSPDSETIMAHRLSAHGLGTSSDHSETTDPAVKYSNYTSLHSPISETTSESTRDSFDSDEIENRRRQRFTPSNSVGNLLSLLKQVDTQQSDSQQVSTPGPELPVPFNTNKNITSQELQNKKPSGFSEDSNNKSNNINSFPKTAETSKKSIDNSLVKQKPGIPSSPKFKVKISHPKPVGAPSKNLDSQLIRNSHGSSSENTTQRNINDENKERKEQPKTSLAKTKLLQTNQAKNVQPQTSPTNKTQPQAGPTNKTQPQASPTNKTQTQTNPTNKIQPQPSPTNKTQPQPNPTNKTQPQPSSANKIQSQTSPTKKIQPQSSPAKNAQLQTSPTHKVQPQTSPTKKIQPQLSPAKNIQPQTSPAKNVQPQTSPAKNVQPQTSPAKNVQPQTSPAKNVQPQTSPAKMIKPQKSLANNTQATPNKTKTASINKPVQTTLATGNHTQIQSQTPPTNKTQIQPSTTSNTETQLNPATNVQTCPTTKTHTQPRIAIETQPQSNSADKSQTQAILSASNPKSNEAVHKKHKQQKNEDVDREKCPRKDEAEKVKRKDDATQKVTEMSESNSRSVRESDDENGYKSNKDSKMSHKSHKRKISESDNEKSKKTRTVAVNDDKETNRKESSSSGKKSSDNVPKDLNSKGHLSPSHENSVSLKRKNHTETNMQEGNVKKKLASDHTCQPLVNIKQEPLDEDDHSSQKNLRMIKQAETNNCMQKGNVKKSLASDNTSQHIIDIKQEPPSENDHSSRNHFIPSSDVPPLQQLPIKEELKPELSSDMEISKWPFAHSNSTASVAVHDCAKPLGQVISSHSKNVKSGKSNMTNSEGEVIKHNKLIKEDNEVEKTETFLVEETNSSPTTGTKNKVEKKRELKFYTKKFLNMSDDSSNVYSDLLKGMRRMNLEVWNEGDSEEYNWEVNLRWLMMNLLKDTNFKIFKRNIHRYMTEYPKLEQFYEYLKQ